MNIQEITMVRLAVGYGLLIFPFALLLWYRIPIVGRTGLAVIRMTIQLLFVGLYLQVVFQQNSIWLNLAWLLIMILVADLSIIHGCEFRLRIFLFPLFFALIAGTSIPLVVFVGLVLKDASMTDAQYVIPIGGMILGNCLRADIIGVRGFYESIRKSEKAYLHTLAQGATQSEAIRPFIAQAYQSALAPTIATMSTIGLVSLPGMMTGVILGGAAPWTAIRYQIAIMLSIFSGTAITIILGIWLTTRSGFNVYGVLNRSLFVKDQR
ncbi:MAG: ABC transporter permease [Sedimentisphaerales bacterium]|nr:ABC transporter permease [Sedimentisphaerales bacterium]